MSNRSRRNFRANHQCQPIRGANFTFRSLHSPDGRRREGAGQFTLDKMITITLPAIEGEKHKMKETMRVNL